MTGGQQLGLIVPGPHLAPSEVGLRTGAWYGDRTLQLPVPSSWRVNIITPNVGKSLTDSEIAEQLESPVGQPTIRELARGKTRPLIIVDDLNRPTPAFRVVPALLRQFQDAGIAMRDVGIIMASGTHGSPPDDALIKKVGAGAAGTCRVYVHDCTRDVVKVGRTSFGTPVYVNKHIAASDFLVGIGGIYPNYTAGFGGGLKMALGVLGFASIAALHCGHQSMGWGTPNCQSNFRRDLDQIAHMIGLGTTVSLLLNGDREVVAVSCGDPQAYYAGALRSAQDAYRAALPDAHADVVVSNAYLNDLSLTFVRMKGIVPLKRAPAGASKIAIASCSEGLGFHRLFPFLNAPRHHRRRMLAIRARVLLTRPRLLAQKMYRRLSRRVGAGQAAGNPIWLYRPEVAHAANLPAEIPGIRVTASWNEIVESVSREQGGREALRAVVYSCATSVAWLNAGARVGTGRGEDDVLGTH
jgi:nickel-dependent lactate racemase